MKNSIGIEIENTDNFIDISVVEDIAKLADGYRNKLIHEATEEENGYLGWLQLPVQISDDLIIEIQKVAQKIRTAVDVLVVIGIGGSYLGAKAVIDALKHSFLKEENVPEILYAGHNINEDYLSELIDVLEGKSFGLCVVSKSGTTTEPAVSFRILKSLLEKQVGAEKASERIVVITDEEKGALRLLAKQKGYSSFVIPNNIGGRYSVLTPVGLFPIACAGIDITQLIEGAKDMQKKLLLASFQDNIALKYAVIRNALYQNGKEIEALVSYHPKLQNIGEWWKQLYGESEGKDNKGIFPTTFNFTTDLHSMGQYIQEGRRIIFETVLSVEKSPRKVCIPKSEDDLDKLNYLSGKFLDEVNKSAEQATTLAHVDGGVPNMRIVLPELNAYYLGQLIYFFELSCAISGRILNVNPFDQPGVEAYKENMFALLGKDGYETETEILRERIKKL